MKPVPKPEERLEIAMKRVENAMLAMIRVMETLDNEGTWRPKWDHVHLFKAVIDEERADEQKNAV